MTAPLSRVDFEAIVRIVCPHCRAGDPPRKRASTGEFVHTTNRAGPRGGNFSHTICWAHGLRASEYAPAAEPGDPEPPMAA